MTEALDQPRPYHHGALQEAALAVALRRLREGNGEMPTVRDIAGEVGVTHRALYRYFSDKEALEAAVAGEGFALLAAAMANRSGEERTSRRVIEAYIHFAIEEPNLYRLMFWRSSYDLMADPYPGPQVRKVISIATEAFARTDPSSDVRDRVVSAWGMAHGLIDLWRSGALRASNSRKAAHFILSRLAASGLIDLET